MTGISSLMVGGKVVPVITAAAAPSTGTWTFTGDFYETTVDIVATPTGGTGPYTYAWEFVSGPTPEDSGFNPIYTFATVKPASVTNVASVVRCLVTDSLGASTYTNNVSIS